MVFVLYIFICLFCFGVVLPKNRMYSLLSLVSVFILSSIFLISVGLELIGLLTIFIYVGAICILFLFILMFLEVRFLESNKVEIYMMSLWQFVGLTLLFIMYLSMFSTSLELGLNHIELVKMLFFVKNSILGFNVSQIGNLFYTEFVLGFLLCGFILLVAMMCVILISSLF